jgi:hypothetical protein
MKNTRSVRRKNGNKRNTKRGGFKYDKKSKSNRKTASIVLRQKRNTRRTTSRSVNKSQSTK